MKLEGPLSDFGNFRVVDLDLVSDEMPGLADVAAIVARTRGKGREREPCQCQDQRDVVSGVHD
jgi:hypothetical protein